MKLVALLEALSQPQVSGARDDEVLGLQYDSRRVRPGDLFFALPGQHHDGGAFAVQAIERGAIAVVSEAALPAVRGTVIRVTDARRAMAEAACRFHGYPSRDLTVVAVTGTNGKTTTTTMLESIFRHAGLRAGVIGTTGIRVDGEQRPSAHTTPEAPELQQALADMRDRGVQAVAIEASSHALAQRRTFGLECDACVFTNLTQDHLDFHGTMESYLDAKLMLFDGRNGVSSKRPGAIVNADDARAPRVIEAARAGGMRTLTFGMDRAQAAPAPDVSVRRLTPGPDSLELEFRIRIPVAFRAAPPVQAPPVQPPPSGVGTDVTLRLPLLGRFNASNAAAAWGAALALDLDARAIAQGLERVPGVPGRLERIAEGQPFQVVVDYAHTPDALERSLAACRDHAAGRLLVVFGCGGDRDRAKRPIMGAIAERGADQVWITNDNPRGEAPAAIAAEITLGMARAPRIVLDRREAIDQALELSRPGDLVLIAGKGHETTQTVGGSVLPFDDREVARELLRARFGAGR